MTAERLGRSTARWVGLLFVLTVLLQRFAVPGMPVALLLPVVLAWGAWGVARGLATIEPMRLLWWLLAAGTTALAMPLQMLTMERPYISPTSWALVMTSWAPFVLRLNDRRASTYRAALRWVVRTCMVLAVGSIVMIVTQLAGVPYRDWLAEIVPSNLLLQDFVITYPITYGSPIYRGNAWIGLEPATVSAQLGIGLLAALLLRARIRVVALLLAGMVCVVAGSGFAIAGVGILVMLLHPFRSTLKRYAIPAGAVLLAAAATPMGQSIFSRSTEISSTSSSTSLRAVQPYQYLWPMWTADPITVLFGFGPGSSQDLVNESGILGLLVATPIKIFFDYGLIAGSVLAVFLLLCYWRAPSRAIAVGLLASMWLLQPGTTVIVLIALLLLLVTLWSPSLRAPLESLGRGRRDVAGDDISLAPATVPAVAGYPRR